MSLFHGPTYAVIVGCFVHSYVYAKNRRWSDPKAMITPRTPYREIAQTSSWKSDQLDYQMHLGNTSLFFAKEERCVVPYTLVDETYPRGR
jgi:hypothetical protein